MKKGAELITEERHRQINKCGNSAALDDNYKKGTLAMAAITYATVASSSPIIRESFRERAAQNQRLNHWPWESQYLRVSADDCHSSRIRELTKAGALIAAEIDKLQREDN